MVLCFILFSFKSACYSFSIPFIWDDFVLFNVSSPPSVFMGLHLIMSTRLASLDHFCLLRNVFQMFIFISPNSLFFSTYHKMQYFHSIPGECVWMSFRTGIYQYYEWTCVCLTLSLRWLDELLYQFSGWTLIVFTGYSSATHVGFTLLSREPDYLPSYIIVSSFLIIWHW